MGNDGGDLLFGDAVFLGGQQMVFQLAARQTSTHEYRDHDDTAGFEVNVRIVPVLPERSANRPYCERPAAPS